MLVRAMLCALALISCDDGATRSLPSAPAPSAPASTPRAPASSAPERPPSQPPIRDNSSASAPRDGAVSEVRLFVSSLEKGDPIAFAWRLVPVEPLAKGHPWLEENVDWAEALRTLRFVITTPDRRSHRLEIAESYGRPLPGRLSDFLQVFSIDGRGLEQSIGRLAWKKPVAGMLDAPGRYTLAIEGTLETDRRKLPVDTKPIAFDVVKADAGYRTIEQIEQAAAAVVAKRNGLKAPPRRSTPTVDDDGDRRVVRFALREERSMYHIEIVEVWLDPAGKVMHVDAFRHFTCVAAGTPVLTPRGEIPIEALTAGDAVIGFDVASGRERISVVEDVARAHAEELYELGRLRVTGTHPVFADGRWQLARDVQQGARLLGPAGPVAAAPRRSITAATVFDLSVSAPHTYFAGGVLLHNKAAHNPIGGRQPWRGLFYRRAARQPRGGVRR